MLERYVPGMAAAAANNPQARGMTLHVVQHFDPRLTDEVLAKIDADLAKIPEK